MSENLAIPNQVVHDTLNGAANHEAKIVLGSLILSEPDDARSSATLARTLRELQEGENIVRTRSSTVRSFCEHSLEPIAHTVTGSHAEGWRATTDYREEKLALLSLLGHWSLRWPDLSVQQVYGPSISMGKRYSPQTRHTIYRAVYADGQEHEALSQTDVAAALGPSAYKYCNAQLDIMADLELLSLESKQRGYNPGVHIAHADYWHNNIALEDTSPETRALYGAIAQLGAGTTTSVNELIALSLEINPEIDGAELGIRLRHRPPSGIGYPGLQLQVEPPLSPTSRTAVELHEAVTEPIGELLSGIKALQQGVDIDTYIAKAEMLASPEMCNRLLRKACTFSPHAERLGPKTLSGLVKDTLHENEALSVSEIRSQLIQQQNTVLTRGYIRELLNELIATNTVLSDVRYDGYSRKTRKSYRLNPKIELKRVGS